MNNSDELNLKLLDRSVERHEDNRASFFRDLKFVSLALLVFQFLFFFKYCGLSDERLKARAELKSAVANQTALASVRSNIDKIRGVLKNGTDQLTIFLSRVPSDISGQLSQLAKGLDTFRQQPLPVPKKRSQFFQSNAASVEQHGDDNARTASGSLDGIFLAGLTNPEKTMLHDDSDEGPEYQTLVTRIIESNIIQPKFRSLNAMKETCLLRPLVDGMSDLRSLTNELATLRKNGANVDDWLTHVENVATLAGRLNFSPPASNQWWSSRQAKEAFAHGAQLDMAAIGRQAGEALSGPQNDMNSLSQKMETAVVGLKREAERIDAGLQKLQTNSNAIDSLIESYAKPLAAVALEPKDLVFYYPVILSAVIFTFTIRLILLRQRARVLAGAYKQLGLSKNVATVCFRDLPELPDGETSRGRLMSIFWALPICFAVASFLWILLSKSLNDEAPRLLYLVSVLVLAVACLLLLGSSHKPSER
jgi:hypothetical protein